MTFDEFRTDILAFLEDSTVNLGRRETKTRLAFIDMVKSKLDAFGDNFIMAETCSSPEKKQPGLNPMGKSVLCIKPSDRNKGLNAGKGVHAMTPSESMRADEQLGRSPYSGAGEGQENE